MLAFVVLEACQLRLRPNDMLDDIQSLRYYLHYYML
jgi:hypothetical protein